MMINRPCVSRSVPELQERDQPALRSPCEWGYRMQLRPRLRLLRRLALRNDREPVGPGSHPNLLESVLCSSRPLASAAKRPLGLRSEFVRSDHKNRIRNGIRNLYDSQVTTGIRLPERDSRASLSRSVFHWMIQDGLDFVFCHVVTANMWLSTSRIVVVAYPHLTIFPRRRDRVQQPDGPAGSKPSNPVPAMLPDLSPSTMPMGHLTGGTQSTNAQPFFLFPARQVGSVSAALPGSPAIIGHAVGQERVRA